MGQKAKYSVEQMFSASPLIADMMRRSRLVRFVPTRDMNALTRGGSQGILVDPSILHDDLEILTRVGDQVEVANRIAIDQKQVS